MSSLFILKASFPNNYILGERNALRFATLTCDDIMLGEAFIKSC